MHIAALGQYDALNHLRERLSLKLQIDKMDYFATGKLVPEEILSARLLSQNLYRRQPSTYVHSAASLITGGFSSAIKREEQNTGIGNLSKEINTLLDKGDRLLAVILELEKLSETSYQDASTPAVTGSEASKGGPGNKQSLARAKVWEDMIKKIWAEEGILGFMADTMAIKADYSDSENIMSMVQYIDMTYAGLASNYVDSVHGTAYIGPESSDTAGEQLKDPNYVHHCLMKLKIFRPVSKAEKNFSADNLLKPLKVRSASKLSSIASDELSRLDMANLSAEYVNLITIVNTIDGLHYALGAMDYGDAHMKMEQPSESRPLNMVIAEAQRVVDMYKYQMFGLLAIPVGLAQIAIRNIATPFIIEQIKSLSPRLAITYDVEKLLNDFLALPASPTLASLASDLPSKGQLLYRNDVHPLHYNYSTLENTTTDKWIASAIGTLREIIPLIYALMTSKRLLEMYQFGAQKLSGVPVTTTDLDVDHSGINVAFTQWGKIKTKGRAMSSLTQLQNCFLYDWGLNTANGSPLLLHMERLGVSMSDYLLPFHTGIIEYESYRKASNAKVSKWSSKNGNRIVAGIDAAKSNIPILVMKKNVRKREHDALIFDRRLAHYMAASAMPFSSADCLYTVKNAEFSMERKEVVGKYDIEYENQGVSMIQIPYYEGSKAPEVTKTNLAAVLNVGKQFLEPDMVRQAISLRRFISLNDATRVNCPAVVKNEYAILMSNAIFIVPSKHTVHVYDLVRIDPTIASSDEDLLSVEMISRTIVGYAFDQGESRVEFKEGSSVLGAPHVFVNSLITPFDSKETFHSFDEIIRMR